MITLSRWFASAVIAACLGFAAMAPLPARAQDDTLTRVLVDVADVVLRGGHPYYRYGQYRDADRLVVGLDRYGRPVYYRLVRVDRGRYHDDYNRNPYDTRYLTTRKVDCNKRGDCKVTYYDPRYDRRGYSKRHDGWRRDDHRWDDQRWNDRRRRGDDQGEDHDD